MTREPITVSLFAVFIGPGDGVRCSPSTGMASFARLWVFMAVMHRSVSGQEQLTTDVWDDETTVDDAASTPNPAHPPFGQVTRFPPWIFPRYQDRYPGFPTFPPRFNFNFTKQVDEGAFSRASFQIERYFNIIVLPLSVVLNVMSMMVYLQPHRRKQSVSMVMSALAIADILALFMNWSKMIHKEFDYNIQSQFNFFCRSVNYISYVGRSLSSWYILLFTGERLISVKFPLKKITMVTMRRVRWVLILTTVLVFVSQSYFAIFFERSYNRLFSVCNINVKYIDIFERIKFVMREIFGFFIPSVLTGIFNFFIVKLLHQASKKQLGMTGGSSVDKKKEADNTSLTIMLVVVSTFSIVVYTPRAISQIIFESKDKKTMLDGTLDRLLECMGILNHSCNFLFYCLGGKTFREDFLRMITCRKYKPARSNTITKSQFRTVEERLSANKEHTMKAENGSNAI